MKELTYNLMTAIDPIVYNSYYTTIDQIQDKEDYDAEYPNDILVDNVKGYCREAVDMIKKATDRIDSDALEYIKRMLNIHIERLAKFRIEMYEFNQAIYKKEWTAGDYNRYQFLKYSLDLCKNIVSYYKQILSHYKKDTIKDDFRLQLQ